MARQKIEESQHSESIRSNRVGGGSNIIKRIITQTSLVITNFFKGVGIMAQKIKANQIDLESFAGATDQLFSMPLKYAYYTSSSSIDLNDVTNTGVYVFASGSVSANIPVGVNGALLVISTDEAGVEGSFVKQVWFRWGTMNSNDHQTYIRTRSGSWSSWHPVSVTS